jgi:SAM-dependent methyltransferase
MNFEEIRSYWENRAAGDSSAQSTTQDVYLREIEVNAVSASIGKYRPRHVADVGCGDGRTTARLAAEYPDVSFAGFDYSLHMIENARRVHAPDGFGNIQFDQLDILEGVKESFDLIYTTRCLINLPSWDLQQIALRNIHTSLTAGGVYVMVENFVEGQTNFNIIRKQFELPEIGIRDHNCFFERGRLLDFVADLFVPQEATNISSTYYLVSRVIYSKLCADAGASPDYFDDHHRLAARLPFCGDFGPVNLICLKKR